MPLQAPPPAITVPVSTVSQRGLYEALRDQAATSPEVALAQAEALRSPELRDRIARLAFLTSVRNSPESAGRLLPRFLDREWIGEAGLDSIVPLARTLPPDLALRFTLAAARTNPAVAIREIATYDGLPFAQTIFEEAASLAPEEAVAVAIGNSATAQAVRDALTRSSLPATRLLAALATDRTIPEADRPKLAFLAPGLASGKLSRTAALKLVRRDPEYFHTLVQLRLEAKGPRARWLDRTLENYALMLLRSFRDDSRAAAAAELERFPARDLRLLAAYGRAEDTEETFATLFDRYLLPKLRAGPRSGVLDAPDLHLRVFLAMSLAYDRLDRFLDAAAPGADRSRLLARAVAGLDRDSQPAVEAIAASELMEGTRDPSTLALFAATVAAEHGRLEGSSVGGYYGLLAARLAPHMERLGQAVPAPLAQAAARYAPFLREDRNLNARDLFDDSGRSLQCQFFYDDEDGVASFANFRSVYQADSRWKWQERDGWVLVSANADGRDIVVVSNIPLDATAPGSREREAEGRQRRRAVLAWLKEQQREPRVVVHRGHAYHLDKTLAELNRSARLAYLGSCGSAAKVHVVVQRADRAQVIATRGIGTLSVNDRLLKAINDEILRAGSVEWPVFWQQQQERFRGDRNFPGYIPPHRNEAAILLRAWEEWLATGVER